MRLRDTRLLIDLFVYCQKHPVIGWMMAIFWLSAIGVIAFLWHLGSISLVDETEPLFAEAARQMIETGDWITPYFNQATRFDKPPLIYWLIAFAYKLIGVNEWAVRLPSAFSAIALCCFGFYTLRNFGIFDFRDVPNTTQNSYKLYISAIIGSALIALNPETIAWGRIGVSDMLLTSCMCSALLAFFIGYATTPSTPSQKTFLSPWYLAFYILTALAILAKGPVGIVIPVLTISSFLLYTGNFSKVVRQMRPLIGGAIILAIALPWFILVTLANGQVYIETFFGYHNIERFTSVVNRHSAPWYFYFIVVAIGFAPWAIYLPSAIIFLQPWKRTIWQRLPRTHHLGLFALFWFAAIFVFFTIAVTKLPSYVLPLMPAAAILVALLFSSHISAYYSERGKNQQCRKSPLLAISGWVNVGIFLTLAIGLFFSHHWLGKIKEPTMPNLNETITNSGLPIIGGIILTIAAIALSIILVWRKTHWLWAVNIVAFVAFLIFAIQPTAFLIDSQRQLPLREIATTVMQVKQPQEELIMIGFGKPSLVFYARTPVKYFQQIKLARAYVKSIAEKQPYPSSILILGYLSKFDEAGLHPRDYQILAQSGAYQLVRVSKRVFAQL